MVVNAPFARALATACLRALGAMCLLTAFLLAILIAVTILRGDGPNLAATLVAALAFGLAGAACPRIADRIV